MINKLLEISNKYSIHIENIDLVVSYLTSDLLKDLELALKTLRENFKESIFLSLYIDPEIDDRYLLIKVEQNTYDKRVRKYLQSINFKYLFSFIQKNKYISISTKYVK